MSRDTATESQPDVVRVQEELLEMLRKVGTDAPPPRREVVAPEPQVVSRQPEQRTCAKCGSAKPWGTSNWCPDCGFYPKTGFGGTGVTESTDDAPPPRLIDILPVWAIPMTIGCGGLLITSIAFRFIFYDALARSFLAIAQFLFCGMAVVAVHCRAAYIAVNTGRGWMAFVNPTETWMLIANMMPQKKWLIVVAAVGLTGVATSFLIGPDPEMIVRHIQKENKNKKSLTLADLMGSFTKVAKKAFGKDFAGKRFALNTVGKLISATGKASGGADSGATDFESALGGLAGKADLFTASTGAQDLNKAAEAPPEPEDTDESEDSEDESAAAEPDAAAAAPIDPKNPKKGSSGKSKGTGSPADSGASPKTGAEKTTSAIPKETMECVVYWFTTNANGEVRSLLLATKGRNGGLKFYQKLAVDSLSDAELSKIFDDLKPFRSRESAIKSPYTGKWVKPVVKCVVGHDGLNSDDRPTNPVFQNLIIP